MTIHSLPAKLKGLREKCHLKCKCTIVVGHHPIINFLLCNWTKAQRWSGNCIQCLLGILLHLDLLWKNVLHLADPSWLLHWLKMSKMKFSLLNAQMVYMSHYRPRSEGDNVIGSVRPSVRRSVRPCVCPSNLEQRVVITGSRVLSVCL